MSTLNRLRDPEAARKALSYFKIASIAAGLAMFVLIAEMVLKYALHNDVLSWWGPVHGLIFMALAVATFNLATKMGWPFSRVVVILLASCVPFMAFYMERRVADEVRPQLPGSLYQ